MWCDCDIGKKGCVKTKGAFCCPLLFQIIVSSICGQCPTKVSGVSRVGPGVTLRATEDQGEMETEEGDKLGLLVVGGG